MILHYLLSCDLEESVNQLVEQFPNFKHDGTEITPDFDLRKISGTDRMTIQISVNGDSLELARYMDRLNDLILSNLTPTPSILINESSARFNWNCQEKCSHKIPKILDRQISGGVMSQPC